MSKISKTLEECGQYIVSSLKADLNCSFEVVYDELIIHVPVNGLVDTLTFLRDDTRCQFKTMIDLTAVDYPERDKRFDVVYNLLSLKYNRRVRVKICAAEDTVVPTAHTIFSAAGWYEREVWDMYGVLFDNHPDLRRILSDYGFSGHAQRKDFPLSGYIELRYDNDKGRIVYEPVKLQQEYRSFDFVSPWDGTKYILPGDEKAS